MSAHTPGPWEAYRTRFTEWGVRQVDGVDVVWATGSCLNEGDAKAIAATPDLLDACRRVAKAFDSVPYAKAEAWLIAVRDALAKVPR